MGNQISTAAPLTSRPASSLPDTILGELGGDVQYEKSMGSSRAFKTIRARHRLGPLVVKVFVKPEPSMSLKPVLKRLKVVREALQDVPNILTYQRVLETEKAGYLIRQWVSSNLYDRISTRPFLTTVEKKWISFQILIGMRDARERLISHGDLSTENILIGNPGLHTYISDFSSSYKPAYLPEDDPADFSLFFDTKGRRNCYLAPERFYPADSEVARRKASEATEAGGDGVYGGALRDRARDNRDEVTEAMDVFGAGCVLAEIFMDGTAPFTLSQMFMYRAGEWSREGWLAEIEDAEIRAMIRSMTSLDPSERPTFAGCLESFRGKAFPEVFYTFLHDFVINVNEVTSLSAPPPYPSPSPTPGPATLSSAPGPGSLARMRTGLLSTVSAGGSTASGAVPGATYSSGTTNNPADKIPDSTSVLKTDSDEKIEIVWNEWPEVLQALEGHLLGGGPGSKVGSDGQDEGLGIEGTAKGVRTASDSMFPVGLQIPGWTPPAAPNSIDEGRSPLHWYGIALIILSLICANIRTCIHPTAIHRALDLLLALSHYLSDETKLDRVLPYVVCLLGDDVASTRAGAVRTLTQLLMLVETITPSNAAVFGDYVLEHLRPLSSDLDDLVRSTYAQCIAPLADCGGRFLEMTQAMKADGTFKLAADRSQDFDGSSYEASYDVSLAELQGQIQDQAVTLLTDPSSGVKRAFLSSITPLCIFFGRNRTNDVILSHTITYLNDKDWQLRGAFFEGVVSLAACVGAQSLEKYLLPLMIQALSDEEEFVIWRVLSSLTTLADLGLFNRPRLWELFDFIHPLICHPNLWLRQGAASFVAAAAKNLPSIDVWAIMYPSLRTLLRADIKEVTEQNLLDSACLPLSRVVFDEAVKWAGKSKKSPFWQAAASNAQISSTRGQGKNKIGFKATQELGTFAKNEDDIAELSKLRDRGMTNDEEVKLLALADHISKVATSRQNAMARSVEVENPLTKPGNISLTSLGVSARIIFLNQKNEDLTLMNGSKLNPARLPSADHWQRRFSFDLPRSPGSVDSAKAGRYVSDGHAVEDLRRRLAHAGSSTSVLSATGPKDALGLDAVSTPRTVSATSSKSDADVEGLSASTSTIKPGGATTKQRSRVNVNGIDVGRVSPAAAHDPTTAMGMMNIEGPRRDDDAVSGVSTPVSQSLRERRLLKAGAIAGAGRFSSTYDGHEPFLRNLLERMYLETRRDPLPEFGPRVPSGIPRRRGHANFPPRERDPDRPEGVLIAHLAEHSGAINGFAVSPDHLFFASGSDDGTVRIWDTTRLEKNVTSRSRHTYKQGGKVTCVCMVESSHCLASASTTGTIWVHRVDVSLSGSSMPKYGKPNLIRQYSLEGRGEYATCMRHYNTNTTSNLVFGTSLSRITFLDIRQMRTWLNLQNPSHLGPVTTICLDKSQSYLVAGTSTGAMTLWDLRFNILLRTWRVGGRDGQSRLSSSSGRILGCEIHPTRGKGRWVVVAFEGDDRTTGRPSTLVEVWDVGTCSRVETFQSTVSKKSRRESEAASGSRSLPDQDFPTIGEEIDLDASKAIEQLLKAPPRPLTSIPNGSVPGSTLSPRTALPSPRGPRVLAFLVGFDYGKSAKGPATRRATDTSDSEGRKSDMGFLISAGDDLKIRFWLLGNVEKSKVVSGLALDEAEPSYSIIPASVKGASTIYLETTALSAPSRHSSRSSTSGPPRPQRSTIIAQDQQYILRAHQDAITALAVVDLPFRCLVTGGRDGVIKIFE